jgi:hypothetical protein
MAARRVELQLTPDVAWSRLQQVCGAVGKIEEQNEVSRSLVSKSRYGLNPVRLRIAVLSGSSPNTSVLEIQARGQDVWGVASRKTMDRIVAAFG